MKHRVNKSYFLVLICIFINLSQSCLASMEQEIKMWTSSRLHNQVKLDKLKQLIENENRQAEYKIVTDNSNQNEEGFRIDFGKSEPQLSPLALDCLKEINKRYQVLNSRPTVIDFGAGHGFMSWKMVVAGGYVRAVEQQKSTAKILQANMKKVKPFLVEGENFESVSLISPKDALDFDSSIYDENNKYDIAWSSNFIHFLTPPQLQEFAQHLYSIIKPDGCIFVETIQSVISNSQFFSFYKTQLNKGSKSPGFFIVNKFITQNMQIVDNCIRLSSPIINDETDSLCVPEDEVNLTRYKLGFYHSLPNKDDNQILNYEDKTQVFRRKVHKAYHFFGLEYLTGIFSKAGFQVEKTFYSSIYSNKILYEEPKNILENANDDKGYRVSIVARKFTK